MLLFYLIAIVIWILVNAGIYGLGLVWLVRGVRFFPRKLHLFLLPALLVSINLYAAFIHKAQKQKALESIGDGIVYQVTETPSHVEMALYNSSYNARCGSMCAELLLEKHVAYVTIASAGANGTVSRVTYKRSDENCFHHPSVLSKSDQRFAFHGYCIVAAQAPSEPEISIVQGRRSDFLGLEEVQGFGNAAFVGIGVFRGGYPSKDLLAIQATGRMSYAAVPVLLNLFNLRGMEGAAQFDGGIWQKNLDSTDNKIIMEVSERPYRVRDKEYKLKRQVEARRRELKKYELLNRTLGMELDYQIDLPLGSIGVTEAEKKIRLAFESNDEGQMNEALALALEYEGFPFSTLISSFSVSDKTPRSYIAQSYVNRWLKATDPVKYKLHREEQKKRREAEKAKLAFEREKRFCELESRRDGRDCSKYLEK